MELTGDLRHVAREDCVLMMMTLLWLVLKYLYYLLSAGR